MVNAYPLHASGRRVGWPLRVGRKVVLPFRSFRSFRSVLVALSKAFHFPCFGQRGSGAPNQIVYSAYSRLYAYTWAWNCYRAH